MRTDLSEEKRPVVLPATAAAPAVVAVRGKTDRWTVLDVLRWTTARFEERGLATPRLDAEVLIAAALEIARVRLYADFDRPLGPTELAAIRESVRRRQAGESVAYIVGRKEFFGLDFAVDHRVLVPRPDTETLVDEALARLAERPASAAGAVAGFRIADVGTGSGAIAVTLAKRLATPRNAAASRAADAPATEPAPAPTPTPAAPFAVLAVDISADALEVARANAERHAVASAVTFVQGDLAAPLQGQPPFDLVVANLPYIPTGDLAALPPEVRSEPATALDGGADGLDLVRRLVAAAPGVLAPGGALALEIGAGQAATVADLLRAAGFEDLRLRRDLGAVDRVVSGRRPAA